MTHAERIYRVLLRAYPARTRAAMGHDMAQLFTDRMREAGSRRERAGVWLGVLGDVVATAPRERLAATRIAARRVAEGPRFDGPSKPDLLMAATPLLVIVVFAVAAPGYWEPLFDRAIGFVGLPLGVGILAITALLASAGIFLARRTDVARPRVKLACFVVCLVPMPLVLVQSGIIAAALYASAVLLFGLLVRFRLPMLALTIPFAIWVLLGPMLTITVLSAASR